MNEPMTILDRPLENELDMAKILEFYFGSDVARNYLENYYSYHHASSDFSALPKSKPSLFLSHSFVWNSSLNGHGYWSNISYKLQELEDNVSS